MTSSLTVPMHVPAEAIQAPHPQERGTPCTMIILGGTGDLTRRKLMPALLHLMADGLLAEQFNVVGVGRDAMTDAEYRAKMRAALGDSTDAIEKWDEFAARVSYIRGNVDEESMYTELGERLAAFEHEDVAANAPPRGRLFYLALPPSTYESVLVNLSSSGLAPRAVDGDPPPWARVIIEKPFGHSLESARALNRLVRSRYAEQQIFRIDHYLGKETVQNILVFRFANSVFEPIWNRDHIQHVQITAAEQVGVESRGKYYEEAGVLRDMFQNHLLQLLSLTAMEPPVAFRADAVRTEKTKVLDAVRPTPVDELEHHIVWGQYGPGAIEGQPVVGYREEPGVAGDSVTPTYVALRLFIDNWRWQGVPFCLRSGKRLPHRATEVAIRFRQPPHLMFPRGCRRQISANSLTFRIQPDEGISLCFEIKVPDHELRIATADMNFSYAGEFGPTMHSAYETLLVDSMLGDATLFTRSDGVEAAWRVIDPFIEAFADSGHVPFPNYAAGKWGPAAADALIAADGAEWRTP